MSIFIYRRASSVGARELADAVGGRRFRGRVRPIDQVVKRGDAVVCWGEALEAPPGVKVLNGGAIHNKYEDAIALQVAKVPTITVSRAAIPPVAAVDDNVLKAAWEEAIESAEDFIEIPFARANPVFLQGIKDFSVLVTKLQAAVAAPPRVAEQWLARENNHVGGTDLLNPPARADYWVKKENIVEEVRVHSFNGKSIKAGRKTARPGVQQHPWVRSYDGGWGINYDGFESTKVQRELAHSAVKALGLQFGAVDLGRLADGRWLVLEVNRAPGLDGGTIATYANAVSAWVAA